MEHNFVSREGHFVTKRFFGMVSVVSLLIVTGCNHAAIGVSGAYPIFRYDIVSKYTPMPAAPNVYVEVGSRFEDRSLIAFRYNGAAGDTDVDGVSYTLNEYGLEGNYIFRPQMRLRPYFMLGMCYSDFRLHGDGWYYDFAMKRGGWDVGGGLNYYFSPDKRWFVGTQAYYHYTEYADAEWHHEGIHQMPDEILGQMFFLSFQVGYTGDGLLEWRGRPDNDSVITSAKLIDTFSY